MAINFPTSLDTFSAITDGQTILEAAHHNDIADAVEALEAKVGVDDSSVASSHTYMLANNYKLGAWASRNYNTTYQAATDGFFVGYVVCASSGYLKLKTDGSSPPTTIRQYLYASSGTTISFNIPVRKGDYYLADDANYTSCVLYWIPFGA